MNLSFILLSYNLSVIRRHGEAGSVDRKAVDEERKRIAEIMAQYAPRDRFNFDETRLFGLCVVVI